MAVYYITGLSGNGKSSVLGELKSRGFVAYECKPISWVLDKALGNELPTVYSRRELTEILEEHAEGKSSDIKKDEVRIATGALNFGEKLVRDAMTPRSVVVTLKPDQLFTNELISKLTNHGYSRFPVLDNDGNNVVGILFAYKLINKEVIGKHVENYYDTNIQRVDEDKTLDLALRSFIKTKQKMFITSSEKLRTVRSEMKSSGGSQRHGFRDEGRRNPDRKVEGASS